MAPVSLTPLGGISLGTVATIDGSHDPGTLNGLRLKALQSATGNRADIVHDRDSFTAAFREHAPNPPGRFKYLISELLDGSFQLRVSASFDAGGGLDWSCEHPSLYLGAETLAAHNLPPIFQDRLVAAGFIKIRGQRVFFDGLSGNCATSARSVNSPADMNQSPSAGLITASKLMRSVFTDYSVLVFDSSILSADEYIASR